MNTMILRPLAGAAVGIALIGTMAACGSDSEGSAAPAETNSTMSSPTPSETTSMASGMAETVGSGCSALPSDGPGSLAVMATQPLATAASGNPLLSTLVTAVTKAGLVDTLNSAEALTLFAPTNDAFAALGEKTLNSVLADPEMLKAVLTHHVVEGQAGPDAIVGPHTTLNGDKVTVKDDAGELSVDGASVVCGNIKTTNATVYVVDSVLLPSGK